jgi:hypothetical protein
MKVSTFIDDYTVPVLKTFSLDMDKGILTLTFNEVIDARILDTTGCPPPPAPPVAPQSFLLSIIFCSFFNTTGSPLRLFKFYYTQQFDALYCCLPFPPTCLRGHAMVAGRYSNPTVPECNNVRRGRFLQLGACVHTKHNYPNYMQPLNE